ncbi:MAG: hypothetical protein ACRD68_09690 [Pyrinomonadaceae bacterium]
MTTDRRYVGTCEECGVRTTIDLEGCTRELAAEIRLYCFACEGELNLKLFTETLTQVRPS